MPPRLFAKPILGWASIAMASAMLILFGFALFLILPLLTQPPSLAKEFLEKKEPGIDGPFVVALEYESFAIRTQGIQIALGFLVGILMAVFGLLLFAIGATAVFEGEGDVPGAKFSAKSTAPGLVVMVMSGIIIAFSVGKNIPREFEVIYNQGKNVSVTTEKVGSTTPTTTEKRGH